VAPLRSSKTTARWSGFLSRLSIRCVDRAMAREYPFTGWFFGFFYTVPRRRKLNISIETFCSGYGVRF
jgi:hypothetical protein